jgi:hypothetical protein
VQAVRVEVEQVLLQAQARLVLQTLAVVVAVVLMERQA